MQFDRDASTPTALGVFGILNLTPDSFSDGGLVAARSSDESGQERDERVARAVDRALRLEAEGADVLDVGGESTRPGSDEVSVVEELARVIPVLEALDGRLSIPISIDTRRVAVAEAASDWGATIVNDTAAFRDDPDLAGLVADRQLDAVLMHRQGAPATMQLNPHYEDLISEVRAFFEERLESAVAAGIPETAITFDPGLGFGKTRDQNYELMARLLETRVGNRPFLVGASRKSFLTRFGVRPTLGPEERLPGSLAFVAASLSRSVRWIRVHDVAETVMFIRTVQAIDEATSVEPESKGR